MRTRLGDLTVEITRPESPKFNHPLVFLHGLWTGAWIWEPFATYLAHRGWESWAATSTGRSPPSTGATVLDDLVRALPAAPVVVTHDTGVLAALLSGARDALPALVTIAPLISPRESAAGRGVFAWPQFWRARLGGAHVAPPRGAAGRTFLGGAAVNDRLRPDSGATFRAIATGRLALPARVAVPGLVVSGGADAIVPAAADEALAARYGWERRTCPEAGHFPMLERGWEALADDVHRWIVRTLGAELLAFLDDDESEHS